VEEGTFSQRRSGQQEYETEACGEGVRRIAGSHNHAIASLGRRSVWVVPLSDWSPNGRYEVILCCFAISNQTCAGFANSDTGASKVVAQPLVVLGEASELQLGHGLLGRTRVHGCEKSVRKREEEVGGGDGTLVFFDGKEGEGGKV